MRTLPPTRFPAITGINIQEREFAVCDSAQTRDPHYAHPASRRFTLRPVVFLPEFEVDSLDIEPVTHLRPLFDCLANAVGLERSLNYDERGSRSERQGW